MSAIRGFFLIVIAIVVFQMAFIGSGVVIGAITGALAAFGVPITAAESQTVGLGISLVVAAIAAGKVVS